MQIGYHIRSAATSMIFSSKHSKIGSPGPGLYSARIFLGRDLTSPAGAGRSCTFNDFCSTGLFVSMLVGSLLRQPPQFSVSAQGRRGDAAAAAEELYRCRSGDREAGGRRQPPPPHVVGFVQIYQSGDRDSAAAAAPCVGLSPCTTARAAVLLRVAVTCRRHGCFCCSYRFACLS